MYFPNKTASLTSLFNETSVTLIYGTIWMIHLGKCCKNRFWFMKLRYRLNLSVNTPAYLGPWIVAWACRLLRRILSTGMWSSVTQTRRRK
jgi:hypothetical protein